MKLATRQVEKPWGATDLPAPFEAPDGTRIGEIWFEAPDSLELFLMAKYLFTTEKLSVQVHPNNRKARRKGYVSGKEECWYILDAEPDAVLGLGLKEKTREAKLRAAAMTGAIEQMLNWIPAKKGDFFYVPAGTIHAIGGGLSIVEVQQNMDLTYRLYDYGRPRELHLDEALEVATLGPYDMTNHEEVPEDLSVQLVDGPEFRLFYIIDQDASPMDGVDAQEWHVLPLHGSISARSAEIGPGECGICSDPKQIDLSKNSRSLIACTTL